MKGSIAIVDYGMGNIGSVANAFALLGETCEVVSRPGDLERARAVVLPGVGAFPSAMRNLQERGLVDALNHQVLERGKPFLGMCLGMQLLAKSSTEGEFCKGLGWVD
ncbi:imidazole glycerol phosphate synthase subunit HisH, partial [bacterium]|nr:imidazole glycerol phosphate synthase subunit HisH [bacterium]